ncbi:MAG: hypothetical protein MJK14_03565 [Rivularia sp. ALOHA_DT_140]|nr:hypothetical protein [Rivularia sp. ALOHA_DT_140]
MAQNDEFKKFIPDEGFESSPIVYQVPSETEIPHQERIPSGYDPMSEIELRGRAYRGLSGGRTPWWVLITGWFIFGIIFFGVFIPTITTMVSGDWIILISILPALLIAVVFLVIMWRGTSAKLSDRNNHNRR